MTLVIGPRAEREAFTSRFGQAWPEVESPLRRYLASQGVPPTEIDDVVQEVASRALARLVPFVGPDDLRAWCFVVARRIRVDQLRSEARRAGLKTVDEAPDPAQQRELCQVEDRHLLATVRSAISTMSESERAALMAMSTRLSGRERNRVAVARHRARQRLKRIVGPLAVLPWVSRWHLDKVRVAAVGAAVPAACLMAIVTMGPPPAHAGSAPALRLPLRSVHRSADAKPWSAARPALGAKPERPARTSPAPTATATGVHQVARVTGPRHTAVSIASESNDHTRPIFCTTGTIVRQLCLAPSG